MGWISEGSRPAARPNTANRLRRRCRILGGVVNRFADAASQGIILILHRFCHHVCGRFERDSGKLIGVVPGIFGLGSGGDVGFAGLIAFQIVSVR